MSHSRRKQAGLLPSCTCRAPFEPPSSSLLHQLLSWRVLQQDWHCLGGALSSGGTRAGWAGPPSLAQNALG